MVLQRILSGKCCGSHADRESRHDFPTPFDVDVVTAVCDRTDPIHDQIHKTDYCFKLLMFSVRWSAWTILVTLCATWACGSDPAALRAYPSPLPQDASYDTVVNSQNFPTMKYPVTIIGAKVHPEEVHVTPSGELILLQSSVKRSSLCRT